MNLTKILGLLAVGGLLVVAAPGQQAQAASLINPGIAGAVQESTTLATDVQYRRHHHHYRHHRHWRRHHHHYRPHRHWHRHHYHHRHRHHHHRHHWR